MKSHSLLFVLAYDAALTVTCQDGEEEKGHAGDAQAHQGVEEGKKYLPQRPGMSPGLDNADSSLSIVQVGKHNWTKWPK